MLMKKINYIEFGIVSPQTARKMSALEIKSPETYDKDGYPMESGLMDPHLGVITPGLRCKTCGQKMKQCPGHFGHVELVRPVAHSEFGKRIEILLHGTCQGCGRICLPDEKIEQFKEILNDLSSDEVLAFTYFSFPEWNFGDESMEYKSLVPKRKRLALSLYEKGKVSAEKAAFIAGIPLEDFIHEFKQVA